MTDYFSHDVEAADDIKLQEVQMDMGGLGYAIFWRLLELLWKNGGKMAYKPALLAYNLRWATAEDIDKVVNNYGLFEVRDGQFWSESQLARRKEKDALCEERKAAARTAANARWKDRESAAETPQNAPADADAMRPQCASNADAMPNKLINKLINKYLSLGAGAPAREREERERIFISFFFLNFKDPAREVERYWSNYAGVGWISRSGNPITDKVAYSDGWKPEQPGQRFNATALRWLKDAYAYARAHDWEAADLIPFAIHDLQVQDGTLLVVFNDKEAGAQVRTYIESNNLTGDWQQILWQARVKTKTK